MPIQQHCGAILLFKPCTVLTCVLPHVRFAAAGLPDAATYRDVCVALRQEHDKEVAISQQLQVRLQNIL
jgi:hypothetical protein